MGDLRDLAQEYVALTGQIEEVRRAMLACLTNGAAGENPQIPFSPPVRRGPDGKAAEEAKQAIVKLLQKEPGLGTTAIARATGANVGTTQDRLKRLRQRGEVAGGQGDGWRVTAAD
jgi:hypothetical protein